MNNGADQDFINKLVNYLETKQHKKLQLEVKLLGKIEDQHPIIIFYYAVSLSSYENLTKEDLVYASNLFEKVYLADKSNFLPLQHMVLLSSTLKKFTKVKKYVEERIKKDKDNIKLIESLAMINHSLGNDDVSIKYFKELYKKEPEAIKGRTTYINSLQYASSIDQKEYFHECKKYANTLEKAINIERENFNFDTEKNIKPKIAFISGDFKKHSVTRFFTSLISNINKNDFEILLFCNVSTKLQDEISKNLKNIADQWFDVKTYSDDELTNLIRSLNINILIDLSGYTFNNRHEVLARRCAKFQIGWLGYNNTLCLTNLDYLIADKNLIMQNEESMYKEKVLYLPKIWNSLSVPENLPDIEDKKISNKAFTFGSFNNFRKLSDDVIEVWSKILTDTNSQIILKEPFKESEDIKKNIYNKFINKGVTSDQLIFLGFEKKDEDHYKHYNKINLALDTFPYPGVTTTFESLLMGVPVITMKGFNFVSRCGASINKNIGMPDLIASNYDEYISTANKLSNDCELHAKNGYKLREKVINSPLCDTITFAKDFEKLLKRVLN